MARLSQQMLCWWVSCGGRAVLGGLCVPGGAAQQRGRLLIIPEAARPLNWEHTQPGGLPPPSPAGTCMERWGWKVRRSFGILLPSLQYVNEVCNSTLQKKKKKQPKNIYLLKQSSTFSRLVLQKKFGPLENQYYTKLFLYLP